MLYRLASEYNKYIIEFFNDEYRGLSDVPVCLEEFYTNEFLGLAEEEGFSWKLYDEKLRYSFTKLEDGRVDVLVEGLLIGLVVPDDVFNSDNNTLIDYIEAKNGEVIFNVMHALTN